MQAEFAKTWGVSMGDPVDPVLQQILMHAMEHALDEAIKQQFWFLVQGADDPQALKRFKRGLRLTVENYKVACQAVLDLCS